jgi:predicted HNH restriction endonuclease
MVGTKGMVNKGKFKKGCKPWHTGKNWHKNKIGQKVPALSLAKKGKRPSIKTEFKEGLTGSRHPAWKGGLSSIRDLISNSERYKLWRNEVFKKDHWTCQDCKSHSSKVKNIEAHHKKELIKIIREHNIKTLDDAYACKELWDINNGVTLCGNCHKVTHKSLKGGKKNKN